jgi:hypothetical protein
MTDGAPVNVKDFGAKLDGVTDDTAAWNAAMATGRCVVFPEGRSVITDKISFSATWGNMIVGEGREKSAFLVNSATFNMAASGVLEFNAAYQGVKKLSISFVQPNTAIRANVTQYPPAINANGWGRAEMYELRFDGAWIGISMLGNCGGTTVDDIHMGALFKGLIVDGSLDSVRVNRYHFWPFGIAHLNNLYEFVYSDGGTFACEFGRCDDLNIGSILTFRGRIRFVDNGSGSSFGVASCITLDSDYGRLEFVAGEMAMAAVYGSTGAQHDFLISCTGGELKIASLALECGVALLTYPMVLVEGPTARFLASDIQMTIASHQTRAFRLDGGVMHLSNGNFWDFSGQPRSLAVIEVVSGRATLTGLRMSDIGPASGEFIRILADDYHVVSNNSFTGWGYAPPASKQLGVYGPNVGTASRLSGSDLVAPLRCRRVDITLDASGNGTAAHGIPSAGAKVVSVSAFYVGAGSERVAFTGATVDGTNVIVAAGIAAASAAAEVWIQYA